MRGKLAVGLGFVVFVTGLLAWSAPAMADSVTTLPSFSDPRNAMPQRPGHTIKRVRWGYTASQDFVLFGAAIHNALRHDAPRPCTNCYITDIVPRLVYMNDANHPDGTVANLDTDAMLHHFVVINRQRPDPVCPGASRVRSANGSSRPATSAARCTSGAIRLSEQPVHLVADLARDQQGHACTKSLNIEFIFQYRTSGALEAKPLWFDIDGCVDSEYTTPVGYHDATVDWTSTVNGRLLGLGGHQHDVDITNSSPCVEHCPEKGHGIALSAEVVGGDSDDYFGPVPPNNSPPASLTGASCAVPRLSTGPRGRAPDIAGTWTR